MEFTPSQEERKSFAFNAKLFILDAITLLLVLPGYGILKNDKIIDNSLRTRFQYVLPDGKLCLPKGGAFLLWIRAFCYEKTDFILQGIGRCFIMNMP